MTEIWPSEVGRHPKNPELLGHPVFHRDEVLDQTLGVSNISPKVLTGHKISSKSEMVNFTHWLKLYGIHQKEIPLQFLVHSHEKSGVGSVDPFILAQTKQLCFWSRSNRSNFARPPRRGQPQVGGRLGGPRVKIWGGLSGSFHFGPNQATLLLVPFKSDQLVMPTPGVRLRPGPVSPAGP